MAHSMHIDAESAERTAHDAIVVNEEISRRLAAIRLEDRIKLSSLNDEDFEKMYFLLSPYLSENSRPFLFSPGIPTKKIEHIVQEVSRKCSNREGTVDPYRVVYELLYVMKRFRLLREQPSCRLCKHNAAEVFEANSANVVSRFWRNLFYLCENLDDGEASFLRDRFYGRSPAPAMAESTIRSLWEDGRLSEANLTILTTAFKAMDRDDLASKVERMQMYPMELQNSSQKVGLAIIINQITFDEPTPFGKQEYRKSLEYRKGTEFDEECLRDLWNCFGLEVSYHRSLTSQQVQSLFDDILSKEFVGNVFVCCILSHGDTGFFLASDRVAVALDPIYERFGSSEHFVGKPKLFFVQACQGAIEQTGVGGMVSAVRHLRHDGPNELGSVPLSCDMLIGTSTLPGFVSYRSEEKGSIYIQHLVQALKEQGQTLDINEIMVSVNCRVATEIIDEGFKQMTNVVNRLRYKLYFKKYRDFQL